MIIFSSQRRYRYLIFKDIGAWKTFSRDKFLSRNLSADQRNNEVRIRKWNENRAR